MPRMTASDKSGESSSARSDKQSVQEDALQAKDTSKSTHDSVAQRDGEAQAGKEDDGEQAGEALLAHACSLCGYDVCVMPLVWAWLVCACADVCWRTRSWVVSLVMCQHMMLCPPTRQW